MGAQPQARLRRHNRTLDLQDEEDVSLGAAERFEVALSLGDDQVRVFKVRPKFRASILKHRSRRVGSVVDDLRDVIEAGNLSVHPRGIVDYRRAAHCHRDTSGRKLFNQ